MNHAKTECDARPDSDPGTDIRIEEDCIIAAMNCVGIHYSVCGNPKECIAILEMAKRKANCADTEIRAKAMIDYINSDQEFKRRKARRDERDDLFYESKDSSPDFVEAPSRGPEVSAENRNFESCVPNPAKEE